ncbi:IS66 family insertion sequence element accessory protein TnpA [Paenibacillus dokdonensis]
MSAWCSANNRSVEQLKYWLRKLKSASSPSTQQAPFSQWVPLTLTPYLAPTRPGPLLLFELVRLLSSCIQALTLNCFAKLCKHWSRHADPFQCPTRVSRLWINGSA